MTAVEFSSRMAEVRLAMEHEEWGKAIGALENIGTVPEKFLPVFSSVLFFLYMSRNEFGKLGGIASRLEHSKSKDSVAALLLLRNRMLGYAVETPADWDVAAWENAIETHAQAGLLEPGELHLCLYFLSFLNRPRLLEMLHGLTVENGGSLNDESVEIVLRCFLKNRRFAQARRFLWTHNLNNVAFERFNFLINRAENAATTIPESDDKFLRFLRFKFGSEMPAVFQSGH